MALSTATTGPERGPDALTTKLAGQCTAVVRLFGLLALMIAAFAAPAAAQDFPALTGRVVDQADILSESDEVSLTQELAMLEQRTGRQLVVATVPSLQGYPIEDFGYQLGRNWGIGAEDKDDGVLLLVAPEERQVSIEVGYGLEPVLTDTLSKTIIEGAIIPKFREGDYPAGIQAGVAGIVSQLELPPEEARARVARNEWLASLAALAAGRISILPGGGVSERNAAQVVLTTRVHELHLSAGRTEVSGMSAPFRVPMEGARLAEDQLRVTDADRVRALHRGAAALAAAAAPPPPRCRPG